MIKAILSVFGLSAFVYGIYFMYLMTYNGANPFQ